MINKHTELIKEILLESSKFFDLCLLWENNTGVARSMDGKRIIKFGLEGSADIIGLLNTGKFIGIECKTGNAKQSKKQKIFEQAILKRNGYYVVVKSAKEAIDFIKKMACL